MRFNQPVLFLGFGYVARAVSLQVAHRKRYATTRDPMRVFEMALMGIEPIVMVKPYAEIIEPIAEGADVLVSFPPDGYTDQIFASACQAARSVVYISSTQVYGETEGLIDDTAPVAPNSKDALLRVQAENTWREVGATILRPPAIYGPHYGLHRKLLANKFKLSGNGEQVVSRIHVEDLTAFILAAFKHQLKGETFVVSDERPVPQKEVLHWLCEKLDLPYPESVERGEAGNHSRTNRSIDSARARQQLGVVLQYPSYVEGFAASISEEKDQLDADNA